MWTVVIGVFVAHALSAGSFTLHPSFVEFAANLSWKMLPAAFVGPSAIVGCDLQLVRTSMSMSEDEVVFAVCNASVNGEDVLWVSFCGTLGAAETASDVHFGEVAFSEKIRVHAGIAAVARFVWDYPGFQEVVGAWPGRVFLLGPSRGAAVSHALHALMATRVSAEAL
jgi:hypothetical protein